jgi:hypothetical protein
MSGERFITVSYLAKLDGVNEEVAQNNAVNGFKE